MGEQIVEPVVGKKPLPLNELLRQANEDMRIARRIWRFTRVKSFQIAYDRADDSTRLHVLGLIRKEKWATLREWMKSAVDHEVGEMSLRELREAARRQGMPYYSVATKGKLVSFIVERCKKNVEEASLEPEFLHDEGDPCESLGL